MKYFRNIQAISGLALACSLVSCQKKDETTPQPDKVSISINSPQAASQYKKGDTVFISADVRYISQLHGYELKITDAGTGAVLFNTDGHVHGDSIVIAEKWVDTLSSTADLKLEINAIISHEQDVSTASVAFRSQP